MLRGVRYLGLEEMHRGKKSRFYTMVLDRDDGRILWAKPGRGQAAWQGFGRRLRLAKAQIKAGATDLSAAYWRAVLENLPEAVLVLDKFHIIKLMNERLDDRRRQRVRAAEGPLKLKIKGPRFLLLRHPENLKEEHMPRLDEALRLQEPLLLGWYLKEELRELWSQTSRKPRETCLKDGCDKAPETGIGQRRQRAQTLRTHISGRLADAEHPIPSGKLEGINHKIKTLPQPSYGFHNENFFILKLLSLHHSKYQLLG